MASIFIRKETQLPSRRWPCDKGGKDCNDVYTSQGNVSKDQKLEVARNNFSLQVSEEA